MYFTPLAQYMMLLLRVSMGWFLIYDGFAKFSSKTWSILPSISGSHILPEFFNAIAPSAPLLSQWYPILLIVAGAMILSGLWIRVGGSLAIALLVLTYIPQVRFPYVGASAYIIDSNLLYIMVIISLLTVRADQFWGLGADVRINK